MDIEQNQQQTPTTTLEEWLNLPPGQTAGSVMESLDPTASIFHEDFWIEGTRRDGRLLSQVRPTKVVSGVVKKHAVGSAIVSHGGVIAGNSDEDEANSGATTTASTKVLAATTFQVGQPSPQTPEKGDVVVRLTINSTTSSRNASSGGGSAAASDAAGVGISDLKSFQQQQHADVLQAWLQRMMEEDFRGGGHHNTQGRDDNGSKKKSYKSIPSCLNLIAGKACLRLVVTVVVLEDGGSIKDACLLACMAAWKDTILPILGEDIKEVNGKMCWTDRWFNKQGATGSSDDSGSEEDRMMIDDYHDRKRLQEQRNFRISLTLGVWIDPKTNTTKFLLDPTIAEEACLDGNEVIVTTEIGNEENIQIDYAGRVSLKATDLALVAKLAEARGQEVSKMLYSTT